MKKAFYYESLFPKNVIVIYEISTLYTVHCTVYTVQCTYYSVHCTLIHCTVQHSV